MLKRVNAMHNVKTEVNGIHNAEKSKCLYIMLKKVNAIHNVKTEVNGIHNVEKSKFYT